MRADFSEVGSDCFISKELNIFMLSAVILSTLISILSSSYDGAASILKRKLLLVQILLRRSSYDVIKEKSFSTWSLIFIKTCHFLP